MLLLVSKSLDTDQADLGRQLLQLKILAQLKKVSQWLDMMEDRVAGSSHQAAQALAASPQFGKLSSDSFIASSQSDSFIATSHKPSKRSKRFKPPIVSSSYIPRRKSGIYWIQVRRAAAAVEISLWTR